MDPPWSAIEGEFSADADRFDRSRGSHVLPRAFDSHAASGVGLTRRGFGFDGRNPIGIPEISLNHRASSRAFLADEP